MALIQRFFGVIVIATLVLSSCTRLKTDCTEPELQWLKFGLSAVRELGPYYDQNLEGLQKGLQHCNLTLKDIGSSEEEIRQLKQQQRSFCLIEASILLPPILRDEFETGGYGSELCYLRTLLRLCNLELADVILNERERHLWTMRWSHETERRNREYAAWRNTQCKGRTYQDRRSCLDSKDMLFEPAMCWPFKE